MFELKKASKQLIGSRGTKQFIPGIYLIKDILCMSAVYNDVCSSIVVEGPFK